MKKRKLRKAFAIFMAAAVCASFSSIGVFADDGPPEIPEDGMGPGSSGDTSGGGGSGETSGGESESTSSEITVTETEDGDYYVVNGVLGSFSSDDENDHIYTTTAYYDGTTLYSKSDNITETGAADITVTDSESAHSAIVLKDVSEYTISNANLTLLSDADGSDTSDFTGVGSAIAVFGDSNVTIENSAIESSGVASMPLFVDDGATVTIKSSTLISDGGTLYSSYVNSPNQSTMVAPPWILGIMGTSRCTNLMGTDSVMNVIDSETYAGAWAVLSTDSGSDMVLNVYNTVLELLNADESAAAAIQEDGGQVETADNPYTTNYGSGYGTYAIGDVTETFAGATINVGTYATIFTGGSAVYTNIEEGETYTLSDGVEYTAAEDKVTEINSDTFGFMVHQSANKITINEGTVVNSGYATFLVKSGSSSESVTATVDKADINNGGVLIQVMDNDDATTSGTTSSGFATSHTENSGFNTDTATADSSTQDFTFTNGTYSGNIYNASGSDNSTAGALDATTLNVTLGTGATLIGAAASTAAIHVTYDGSQVVKANGGDAYTEASDITDYQNTSFTISEYWDIGQVANLINSNDGNAINMTLTDGAAWYVDGTSLVTSLSMDESSTVYIAEGASLTIGETTYSEEGTLTYADGSLVFTACDVTIPEDTTDDGTTDDGSTDGGTTDDGTTDDGSTDGGTTDDGSTDGGTTDDGTTDDGSTDGGTTDDGTTDDGSTDGGTTDDGTTDDGTVDDGSGSGDNGSTGEIKSAAKKQVIKVKKKTTKKTFKAKKLKNKKKTFRIKAKAKTKVTYKKVKGSKKIKVSKKGKVTVKKGTKAGKYTITVKATAKKTSKYKKATKKFKVVVKVK